jgi:uncharacterized short protein YbdD (DUF466 family)
MTRKICGLSVPNSRADLAQLYRLAAQTAHLMVGLPDYATYVEHRSRHHPAEPFMSREEFFRECQRRRYSPSGGRGVRCC